MHETYDRTVVLTELPSDMSWRFGGFPYGLEPLTLPYPDQADLPDKRSRSGEFAQTCRRIRMISAVGISAGEVEQDGADDEMFWFRWITGHQVSFVLWRLAAQLIKDVVSHRCAVSAVIPGLIQYVDAYSAMLLYTGSCPRASYHRVIRPSMRLRHPSFSGGWAPDYLPLRSLLRGRLVPFDRSPYSPGLLRAVTLNQLVHEHVAAKLVPDGVSLLRGAGTAVRRQDRRLLNLLFDNYFMTLRAPVSRSDIVAQLLRRLVAVVQDVEVNGLFPVGEQAPEDRPVAEVAECARNLTRIIVDAARSTIALPVASADHLAPADALTGARAR